ncbi:MAG: hypothetical protein JOZ62_16575 [Acidobacteriaceae bacterium]|nr:hypothetical protein [Acidobacteriaceae bacterium]
MTRRTWATLAAAAPVLAQVTSRVPPQGEPAPATSAATPEAKLQKAYDDVRKVKDRLSQIDVPMAVEPSFVFKP